MNNRDDNGNNNNLLMGGLFAPQRQQQQPPHQPDNVEVEDDHDDDNDDDDEDDGIDRDADGVLDGGVAGASSSSNINADDSSTAAARRRASDCDLVLYIVCAENMDDLTPNHPILKEGAVVSIGLDKNTKLSAVFRRYTEFCNEHSNSNNPKDKIEEGELEFFHCQLLNPGDTAEASALMKNDRIKVRRERAAERETQAEFRRIQRESDRDYFKNLRTLLPDSGCSKSCDLILDCQGNLVDENGRNQQVLSTLVRGHSVVLSKRCKWLGNLIQTAREEKGKRNAITVLPINEVSNGKVDNVDADEDEHGDSPQSENLIVFPEGNIVANTSSTLPDDNEGGLPSGGDMDEDDEDDDAIGVLAYPVPQNPPQVLQRGGATEIENDEENDDDNSSDGDSIGRADNLQNARSLPVSSRSISDSRHGQQIDSTDKLWVTLPNHSPEAVKLLMEYCYTNRVIPLGHDAFVQACRTKPVKPNGPVSPHTSSRRWPNNGLPQVCFSVALAGISLAEEAGMHRLSLMCEVAASQLVTTSNVVEALSMCTSQNLRTGNQLTRLREVAIGMILRVGPRGVYDMPVFKRALEERTTSIIPTLLSGTVEAIASTEKQKNDTKLAGQKRQYSAITESYFDEIDREDTYRRERERRARRLERYEKNPKLAAQHVINHDEDSGDVYCDQVLSSSWAAESARKSLKRMSQHLNVGAFHVGRAGLYASRETFGNRVGYGMARRRTNSRRRSSERS